MRTREEIAAVKRKWQLANMERGRKARRKYYASNSELERARRRQYCVNHLDIVHAYEHAWRLANPEKKRAACRKRRAMKRGLTEHFDAYQWEIVKAFYGNQCIKCHRGEEELVSLGLHLVPDHVIPLSKGGTDDIGNIQPLCHGRLKGSVGGCNSHKHNKTEDFRIKIQ